MAALKKLSVGAMKPWFPESNLGESNFTCAFLLNILREKCQEFCDLEKKYKIYNIRAKDISEGSGYLSRVFKCDVILKQDDPNSPEKYSFLFSVILKQPGFESIDSSFQGYEDLTQEMKDKTKKDMIEIIKKFHHNEVTFYKVFGNSALPIPKYYGAGEWIPEKQSGFIIMEYLSGGKFPELHLGLSENQVLNILQFIVKFQTIAHKNENEWKNEFTEVSFGESTDPQFGQMCYENLKRGQSASFLQKVEKLKRFFTDSEVGDFVSGGPWKKLGISSMLIHGDMWTNNVCFKYDYATEKVADEILAVIDWQVVHPGNPLTDVSRVLLMCCNPEIRRKLEQNIIDLYIDLLKKELGDEKLPFTKEELEISKRYSDLENILFSMFMPSIHYHGGNPEADAKRKAYMTRLEALMEDKMPMLEKYFPDILA